jgi:hypothetical protein
VGSPFSKVFAYLPVSLLLGTIKTGKAESHSSFDSYHRWYTYPPFSEREIYFKNRAQEIVCDNFDEPGPGVPAAGTSCYLSSACARRSFGSGRRRVAEAAAVPERVYTKEDSQRPSGRTANRVIRPDQGLQGVRTKSLEAAFAVWLEAHHEQPWNASRP